MFSPTDERPKKPVPMVMVGARNVSNPAAPVEQPTLMATRSTSISAAKRRITAGSLAWIAAECPAPRFRTMARQAVSAASRVAASKKPSTGQSFSRLIG